MRSIKLVSSPCKREEMSRESSKDLLEASRLSRTPSRLNLARISKSAPNSVTFTPAPPTWALVCVPPSTLTCPDGPRTALMVRKPDVRDSVSSPVVLVVNLVDKLATPTIFPTNIVWDTLKSNLQTMIDGVNLLWKEDLELQKKHGM